MLFLGLLFPQSEELSIAIKSRGGVVQNQVNSFQWNCIEGFYANGIRNLRIVNALPVGIYPFRYSDLVIPEKVWEFGGGKHYQLGSLNLPVLKQWARYRTCKKLVKHLGEKEILIYSAYQPFLKAVKKLDRSFKITLIVPDLPDFYDYAKVCGIRRILRKLNNCSIRKCMERVDRFVLLTEAMKDALGVGDRPYMVMEGLCTTVPSSIPRVRIPGKKSVLYTGTLNKQFGIDVLLEAFRLIPHEDYELWICGAGDYAEKVKLAAEMDKRIKYFGYVSMEKVTELQSQATVLVNPRQNIGEYTKYSFPSKTMVYLLSGVPFVAYKLDGIPEDYDPYICYVKDNTPYSLAQALCEVCEDIYGHYETMAIKAVDFLLREKNPLIQTAKILELMGMG